jgi:hypothetical protein
VIGLLVLGFAQVAAAAPASAPVWRASLDDGLSVSSADGGFSVRLGLLVQGRYELRRSPVANTQGFDVRVVRPNLRGTLGRRWVRFFVQPELADANPRLLDLQLDVQPSPLIGLRLGQFLTPFSRAFNTPVPLLQFPDFSVVNNVFRADRDTGVMLHGEPFDGRAEWNFGAFNGNGIDRNGNDRFDLRWMVRLAWNPLGATSYNETPAVAGPTPWRLGVGVNAYTDTTTVAIPAPAGQTAGSVGDQHQDVVGADVAARGGPWTFQAEGYHRWLRRADGSRAGSWGAYAQSGVMLGRRFEVAARGSVLQPNEDASDVLVSGEGMLTAYVRGNHLKVNLRGTVSHSDVAVAGVAQGWSGLVTLQTQLAL